MHFLLVPGPVTNESVVVLSSTSMAVKWSPPSVAGSFVESYIITIIATCPEVPSTTLSLPSVQTDVVLTNLEEGMEYHILLRARNVIGNSMFIDVIERTQSAG